MGDEAEAHSNWSSARFANQRASNYYRLAQDVLLPDDPNKLTSSLGSMRIGGLEHDEVQRSMKLFADQVMPALREEEARTSVKVTA